MPTFIRMALAAGLMLLLHQCTRIAKRESGWDSKVSSPSNSPATSQYKKGPSVKQSQLLRPINYLRARAQVRDWPYIVGGIIILALVGAFLGLVVWPTP